MTTLRRIGLRCPICDNRFQSNAVVATNAFGGKRTDFHEHANGKQPLASSAAMTGSEKYEAAAKVAEWQGADARHIADLWLRAAWCCVLVGELWRRVGDVKLADDWFEKVAGEVVDVDAQQWVILVADQQRREPGEWFS